MTEGECDMMTQVKTWGNSQGIRFSKELLESVGIHINDYLDAEIIDGNIVLKKQFRHKTLEERSAAFHGQTGPYTEFSWGEKEGREQW